MPAELKRDLTLLATDGGASVFTVHIGPTERREDGQWWARVAIDGLWEDPFSIEVPGVDEVQAVKHAFQAVSAKLGSTPEYAAGRLYWLHPDLGHGFG